MKDNRKIGKLYTGIAVVLFALFWIVLILFGLTGNAVSRYVLGLFKNDSMYLIVLGIILISLLLIGEIVSNKAREYSENNLVSKIVYAAFWVTIGLCILAVILFIVFVVMMVLSGSLM
ncbi:hypothetical protein [Butyrivibrio sp. VCB2006]|uniref:hypothetical protein n=1 Tax=Butyrivibrio sp. VCB2006 TaxID=1280679 RepID=UPI0004183B1E|nr:hypothetical protein [Butyrivibrio sp. VCB2006]